MATVFEIFIAHPDPEYSNQAAREAFDELDRLERELSRFIENSDVSRIDEAVPGQPVTIGLDTFDSLKQCERLYRDTYGAFDVTIGPLWQCWFDKDKNPRTPAKREIDTARQQIGFHLLKLDESRQTVTVSRPVRIDLGGFGKGYALDKMAELLRDWDIDSALIHGGRSTVLALNAPPGQKGWPLSISHPNDKKVLETFLLTNRAVSASGLRKGHHIIDPRTGYPAKSKQAAWSFAPTAATADALSTAFMIMSQEEITRYCKEHPGTQAIILLQPQNENQTNPLFKLSFK